MASATSLLELRDCRLLSTHFELKRNVVPDPAGRLTTSISFSHNSFADEQGQPCLRLFVKVLVQGENAPLCAEVEMGGVFALQVKPESAEAASRIAEIDCAAIVFPYLRETVADLTRRAGLPPLHLPLIDFTDYYAQNHPGA